MKVDKPNDNNEFIGEIAKQNLFFFNITIQFRNMINISNCFVMIML